MADRPTTQTLNVSRLILSGVRYNWRISMAVALGVATATAVIVGALLVGDSMRGSLRGLTVQRLGKIESVVAPGGFFAADRIAETVGAPADQLAAVILFDRAVIESQNESGIRRAGSVQTIGCDDAFWKLDVSGVSPTTQLDEQSVILTESLATELGVAVGDLVTVRLPIEQAVPADSPLGRRDVQTEGIPRLEVVEILPDRGLARFSLAPAQASPKNVFLSRELVAEVLEREGKANVLLSSVELDLDAFRVALDDLGVTLKRDTKTFGDITIFDYYSVTSDRLLVDDAAVQAIRSALGDDQVVESMTYLANAIERVDEEGTITHSVPYSTIAAIDSSPDLKLDYQLSRPENAAVTEAIPLVLNSWTAERLEATEGTKLRVAYFEPEVENGKEIERYFDAYVTSIVPITKPSKEYYRTREAIFSEPPTPYNCPNLTPTVPGVTDQDSILKWELPFELTRKVEGPDDDYWNNYRLTPKAFLPLADGQRIFGSRFGQTTGLRIDVSVAESTAALESELIAATHSALPELGWSPRSIRQMQLSASSGTTPFDGLFLALSSFVIFSAVMLIAMLFRLGLVARSREIGTLMALGIGRKRVKRLFLGEGLVIACVGSVLGIVAGIGYALAVLWALRTFWVGAVTVPFLTFHSHPISLAGGLVAGLVIGLSALGWTLRSMLANEAITLLRGRDDADQVVTRSGSGGTKVSRLRWAAIGLFVAAIGAGFAGAMSGGQTAAGGFVGGGMLLLIAVLVLVYDHFQQLARRKHAADTSEVVYSLNRLAHSNAARSPLRSTLTIGLMGTASFLIVAIAAFRLSPSDEGTGGFALVAETVQPLSEDLGDPLIRKELLGDDAERVADATFVSFRVRAGQDASCNNLYRASEPTVFGVPAAAADALDAFHFYATGKTDQPDQTAWHLLDRPATGSEEDPIPMIIDQNTAMWSLQMMQGIGERKSFTYDNETLTFEVVGLLENSLLQGRLIVGETNFEKHFPSISGYRYFLIASDDPDRDGVARTLESRTGDIGLDADDANNVLSGMMAVQNTYLRTFQSLGGLGLLLGTIGLAIAQLRNVLERRSELALMRSIGFTPSRLASLVMRETASLLLMGIGCGALCAVIAVLPYAVTSGNAPPVIEPLLIVVAILLFGLLAGLFAAAKVIRMPLLDSLRGS